MQLRKLSRLSFIVFTLSALAACSDQGEYSDTGTESFSDFVINSGNIAPPPPAEPSEQSEVVVADTSDAESTGEPVEAPVTDSSNDVVEQPEDSNQSPEDSEVAVEPQPQPQPQPPVDTAPTAVVQNTPGPLNQSRLIDPESWNYDDVYAKPGYELVFSDEFNGRDINTDRWHTQLRWDGEFNGQWYEYRIINGEKQFYVNVLTPDGEHRDKLLQYSSFTPFRFDGSNLTIRATANPYLESRVPTRLDETGRNVSYGRFEPLLKRQPFLSGVIASHGKFVQKYGYFEARIRLPAHTGTFPAFWLHHQRRRSENTQRSEIDIMENLGHAPGIVYNTFHYYDYVSVDNPGQGTALKPEPSGRASVGGNFSDNFHVYAVDWRPGSIVWLIDGNPVSWLSSPQVDFEEMYVILNMAIGGNWVNYPRFFGGLGRGETDFYPTIDEQDPLVFGNPEMEIDYVRVYRPLP